MEHDRLSLKRIQYKKETGFMRRKSERRAKSNSGGKAIWNEWNMVGAKRWRSLNFNLGGGGAHSLVRGFERAVEEVGEI